MDTHFTVSLGLACCLIYQDGTWRPKRVGVATGLCNKWCITECVYVGWYTDCKNMHGINNIATVCYVTKCKYCYHHLTICQRVRKVTQSNYSLRDVNSVRPPAWNCAHGQGIAVSCTVHGWRGCLLQSVGKIKLWLKIGQNNRHFTWRLTSIRCFFGSNVTIVAVDSNR